MFKLHPPGDMLPEAWLEQFDGSPTLLPQWPTSGRLALVCVTATGEGPEGTEAVVVISPEELRKCSHPGHGMGRLFFKVPKAKLLDDPEVCPGLTAESFWHQ